MLPSHFRIRVRVRKFCPRPVLRIHGPLLFVFFAFAFAFALVFVFHDRPYSSPTRSRDDDVSIPLHVGAFRLVDDLLDEALHVSLSNTQNSQDGRPRRASSRLRGADAHSSRSRASVYQFPLVSSALPGDLDTLRAQACRILRGRSVFLVGPHETLYQLHSYLLTVLQHPGDPIPGTSTTVLAPKMRPSSCPGATLSYSCPSHPLCHPTKSPPQSSFRSGSGSDANFFDYESPTLADYLLSANSSSSTGSLLRFLNSGNLNPSPTQEDVRLSGVPSVDVDPRTGTRVVDPRWVRYAASSKADILILNRGPLPAPAWSYNKNDSSARNLTWLTTLRTLEQKHAEPLSDLFADVLSRLDHHGHDDHLLLPSAEPDSTTKLVIDAALHSTISTFLPSLLSTLSRLHEHAGHRPVLGTKKPVLWYGSWFLPVSCAPDSLSVFSSSESESPRHLLAQLLTQAEAMNNPWSAYYNAQVYMHDRLLARLLPTYGISYIPSLSTIAPPPEVGQTYHRGGRWSCIRRVFETPRGLPMGQIFLRDFIDALGSWNWDNV